MTPGVNEATATGEGGKGRGRAERLLLWGGRGTSGKRQMDRKCAAGYSEVHVRNLRQPAARWSHESGAPFVPWTPRLWRPARPSRPP